MIRMSIIIKNLKKLVFSIFLLGISMTCLAMPGLEERMVIETIDAKNILNDENGNLILEGEVLIVTNLVQFKTDRALYNQDKGTIELFENTEITSSNLLINTSYILANLTDSSFKMKEGDLNFKNQSYGNTEELYIKTSGDVVLLNTSLNNCSKEDPAWQIETKQIDLIQETSNAIIRGIKFRIGKLPIFYFPYIRTAYGNERLTGFLSPSLKQGGDGIDISLPYYINLAPNYDLEISPRLIADRGFGGSSEFRYLTESSQGEIKLAFISRDKEYKKDVKEKSNRWKTSWIHNGNIEGKLLTNLEIKSTSDEYFFRDIGGGQFGESKTSYLPRKASIGWKSDLFFLELVLNSYQILNPFMEDEYKSTPKVLFSYNFRKKNLLASINSSYSKFKRDRPNFIKDQFSEVERAYFGPEISYLINYPSSELKLSFGSDILHYKNDLKSENSYSPWIESTFKIFLEKQENNRFSHLTPIFKYIYVNENGELDFPLIESRIPSASFNNLYRRSNYSGIEKSPDTNKLIVGLEYSSLKSKSNLSDFTFYLGKAFYLKKIDSFFNSKQVSSSPLIAEFRHYIGRNSWSNGLIEWDHSEKKINSSSFGYVFENDKNTRVELRSIYRRKDLNQSFLPWSDIDKPTKQFELVSQVPLNSSWSFYGRWLNDEETSKSLDILFGFQYSNCCFKAGVMKRKWLDEDYFSWQNKYDTAFSALSKGYDPVRLRDNIYFFIELKGLGRLGKKVSRIISSTELE